MSESGKRGADVVRGGDSARPQSALPNNDHRFVRPERMSPTCGPPAARNDETLERIYLRRRFKNDTERLEKLFELYAQMTARKAVPKKSARKMKGFEL